MPLTRNFFVESFDKEKIFVSSIQNSQHPTSSFLLIHGLTGDAEAYTDVAKYIVDHKKECVVYSIDLRGHGNSSYTFPHTTQDLYDIYVQDLKAVLDKVPHPHLVMVGQSMAGSIIQEFICTYLFKEVAGIALVSAALSLPKIILSSRLSYRVMARYTQKRKFSIRRRLYIDHAKYKNSWDYSPRRILSDIYFSHPSKYVLMWLAVFGWKNKALELFNSPRVALFAGKYDIVIPTFIQRKNHHLIPQAVYTELPSNHNAIVNIPEIIGEELIKFSKNLLHLSTAQPAQTNLSQTTQKTKKS